MTHKHVALANTVVGHRIPQYLHAAAGRAAVRATTLSDLARAVAIAADDAEWFHAAARALVNGAGAALRAGNIAEMDRLALDAQRWLCRAEGLPY